MIKTKLLMLRLTKQSSSKEMHFLHITRCWPSRLSGPVSADTQSSHLSCCDHTSPGTLASSCPGEQRVANTGARRDSADMARCSLELLGYDSGELWRIVMWRESLTWAELLSGHVTILNHDQTRGGGGCVTGLTRVSNLSHLSSNPYTRSTGELSRSLTEPRQPDTDPGPVRLQPVSSTRLGPGLQLKSSLATTEDRLWNHLNICINYLSTKTINVIRLADFVMISGMPGATSGPILFWDCELHEVQLSLESPGEWEVWEQTLNTAGRGQATLQTVSGQCGRVRLGQCCEQAAEREQVQPVPSWDWAALLSPGPTCAHLNRDRRHQGSNKLPETQETWTRITCLSQIWLNKLISFAHLGLLKEFPDDILGR